MISQILFSGFRLLSQTSKTNFRRCCKNLGNMYIFLSLKLDLLGNILMWNVWFQDNVEFHLKIKFCVLIIYFENAIPLSSSVFYTSFLSLQSKRPKCLFYPVYKNRIGLSGQQGGELVIKTPTHCACVGKSICKKQQCISNVKLLYTEFLMNTSRQGTDQGLLQLLF